MGHISPLVVGHVIRAGIGSYDCEVYVEGLDAPLVCSPLTPVLSDTYGASGAYMPVPGSRVLVYAAQTGTTKSRRMRGYILGVVADPMTGGVSKDGKALLDKYVDTDAQEAGVAQYTESGPATVSTDPQFFRKGVYTNGRPHDIVPGEYQISSHGGSGLSVGPLAAVLRGSESASVRCSSLDDHVRVTSGHFVHVSSAGSEEICNDGGLILMESSVSMYQPERLGVCDFGQDAFARNPPAKLSDTKAVRSGVKQHRPTQTAKKRLYKYVGFTGDIMNVFVANPDPSKAVEDMQSDSRDQGLCHFHLDSCGRVAVRSAAGITFERYAPIPIPKRHFYPWDPRGTKASSLDPDEKQGYERLDDPSASGLVLGDMSAWWNRQSYLRLRQFDPDFTIPSHDDAALPDDQYDRIGKATEDLNYASRHSFMTMTADGGIVLRDAWGSEIVMSDGKITFNAASNIEIRAGSSVVVLGGDDVIAKANNSIDISSTNRDVRIKAEKNMQLVSFKSGVLVQSKAEADVPPDDSSAGEDGVSSGVVLKADESTVAVVGKSAEIIGSTGVKLASLDENNKQSGPVVLSGNTVSAVGDNVVLDAGEGKSGLALSASSALLMAPSAIVAGGSTGLTVNGDEVLYGIPVEVGNIYNETVQILKDQWSAYVDSTGWLYPYLPSECSKIDFSFRTVEQYGTHVGSGMSGKPFAVFAPSWSTLVSRPWMHGRCVPGKWEEKPDDHGEYPWPGKEHMSDGSYVSYQESNVRPDTGVELPSDAQSGSASGGLTSSGFSSYHIRISS